MRIGFQGTGGAFSEAAIYNDGAGKAIGYPSFEDIFHEVMAGRLDRGIIPIENTIAGTIIKNADLLLQHELKIVKEIFIKIEHCLIGNLQSELKDIKKVYSHPQALDQCAIFLREHGMKPVAEYDTAGAVLIIKKRKKKDEAAIASRFAASMYSMKVLQEDIAANPYNITRFFLLAKDDAGQKKEKTSIVFSTRHHPGALMSCLSRFSKQEINLTKLESRPILGKPWEYMFYVDFIGGTDDEQVRIALNELKVTSHFVKVLGSYPIGIQPK